MGILQGHDLGVRAASSLRMASPQLLAIYASDDAAHRGVGWASIGRQTGEPQCLLKLRMVHKDFARKLGLSLPFGGALVPNVVIALPLRGTLSNLDYMKKRPNGFTLIELLVVLAIVGVLVAMAVPSFNTMLQKRTVRGAALSLVSDIRYARSEALRRSDSVTICSLVANSTNACTVAGAANWVNGWMVFSDTNGNGIYDAATDEIVRVQQPLRNIATVQGPTPANDPSFIVFQANGRTRGLASGAVPGQAFRFTPVGTFPANTERTVCVSAQGRVTLKDEGITTCP